MISVLGVPLLDDTIGFTTAHKTHKDIFGHRTSRFHTFFPDMEEKWTFQTIGIALNEFKLAPADYRDCIGQAGYYHIAFKDPDDPNIKFHVHIYRDLTIDVKVSTEFLIMHCELICEYVWVRIGSQGRLLKTPKRRKVERAYRTIHPKRESSMAILNSRPMIFFVENLLVMRFIGLQRE